MADTRSYQDTPSHPNELAHPAPRDSYSLDKLKMDASRLATTAKKGGLKVLDNHFLRFDNVPDVPEAEAHM